MGNLLCVFLSPLLLQYATQIPIFLMADCNDDVTSRLHCAAGHGKC